MKPVEKYRMIDYAKERIKERDREIIELLAGREHLVNALNRLENHETD